MSLHYVGGSNDVLFSVTRQAAAGAVNPGYWRYYSRLVGPLGMPGDRLDVTVMIEPTSPIDVMTDYQQYTSSFGFQAVDATKFFFV
jgi:hypothetical protein